MSDDEPGRWPTDLIGPAVVKALSDEWIPVSVLVVVVSRNVSDGTVFGRDIWTDEQTHPMFHVAMAEHATRSLAEWVEENG